MEDISKLVHFKVQDQAETRLKQSGLLTDFWFGDELPVRTFRKLTGLDVIMISSSSAFQFNGDKPEQGLKAITMLDPLLDELTVGLSEIATGIATGVAVSDIHTKHPGFPFDATNYNSVQFPVAFSYLIDLSIRAGDNQDALNFMGLGQQADTPAIMRDLCRRITYEYLRDVKVEESNEPDDMSLNKLLRILEGDIDDDTLEMYPFIRPVQKSMTTYVLRTAYNFATQDKEKPDDMTKGAPAAKSVNTRTGEVIDNLPRTAEQRTAALETLFLKLIGDKLIANSQLIYSTISRDGLINDAGFPEADFDALVEEVTQSHEEVHKMARSVGPAFIYEGKVVNLLKFGFIIAPADMDFSPKK